MPLRPTLPTLGMCSSMWLAQATPNLNPISKPGEVSDEGDDATVLARPGVGHGWAWYCHHFKVYATHA